MIPIIRGTVRANNNAPPSLSMLLHIFSLSHNLHMISRMQQNPQVQGQVDRQTLTSDNHHGDVCRIKVTLNIRSSCFLLLKPAFETLDRRYRCGPIAIECKAAIVNIDEG